MVSCPLTAPASYVALPQHFPIVSVRHQFSCFSRCCCCFCSSLWHCVCCDICKTFILPSLHYLFALFCCTQSLWNVIRIQICFYSFCCCYFLVVIYYSRCICCHMCGLFPFSVFSALLLSSCDSISLRFFEWHLDTIAITQFFSRMFGCLGQL